jgi:hypothetical protein
MTKKPASDSSHVEATTLETVFPEQLESAAGGFWGGFAPWRPCGPAPAAPSYMVQPGDNLTNIAKESGHSLNYLLGLNPQYQKNPNLIHPGEQVTTGRPSYPQSYPPSYGRYY